MDTVFVDQGAAFEVLLEGARKVYRRNGARRSRMLFSPSVGASLRLSGYGSLGQLSRRGVEIPQ